MVIKFSKWLSVLASILTIVIFIPGIALATPGKIDANYSTFSAQSHQPISHVVAFSDSDLTPQERQQIQALRQRRNKEIKKILTNSQREQLQEKLKSGSNLYQALETLNLQLDQQNMIKAIMQFTNLKMKDILSRHALQVG
jgi:DNA-binding TFAR19-related protein (PDSD5 family)